ncbi:MAG: septum site-determining protein MinC [Defluviitaleaceae bacterium]|nr:septum site-determining protein MinC [Defluviitaleaceae bacterium]MCL2835541.1 septum site-determining protein MinC [Defluviitaleaceae bacterium]
MMRKNNSVIFKGRKDGIVILLDRDVGFGEIREALSNKMADAKGFFSDGKSAITFKGRELSDDEEQELLDIIAAQTDMSITFAQSVGDGDNSRVAVTEDAKTDETEALARTIESFAENNTLFKIDSLRSGQSLCFEGSVVVIGDVNPGAEIIAEGNVVVLGKLLGVAHAGCSGVADCFVAALRLQPVQLRIGDKITYFPKSFAKDDMYSRKPLYAFVRDEQIHIAPLM